MNTSEKPMASRKYWRGIEDLEGSPALVEWVQQEFSQHDLSELINPVTRRSFLSLMGASMALAGLTGCLRRPEEYILPYAKAPEDVLPGLPQFYATTFVQAGYALGALVESHEGRPTKIEGNPDHPGSLGGTTPFMQASILDLYDPDRVTSYSQDGVTIDRKTFVTALAGRAADLRSSGGRGLRFLAEVDVSPTLQRLRTRIKALYPEAVWHCYEPISDDNIFAGASMAFGQSARPVYRLSQARVIVSLGSDFLQSEADSVLNARQWADGRRIESADSATPNRLYSVESNFTITGAAADHRLRVRPSQLDAVARTLLLKLAETREFPLSPELREGLGSPVSLGEKGDRFIAVLAKDLADAGAQTAVLVGRELPAHVHALAHQINALLGNVGQTVRYVSPVQMDDATVDVDTSIGGLAKAIRDGKVDTLVVLGGNPVFNAPVDLQLGELFKQVGTTIRLGSYADETSVASKWVAPRSHFLEAWGDALAIDGTASIVQPLIEPLYNSMSDLELISHFIPEGSRQGYDLVRSTWKGEMVAEAFETQWRRFLHDGVIPGKARESLTLEVNQAQVAAGLKAVPVSTEAASASSLEVLFVNDPKLFDGRFANNGWLQELPDPMTKLTWDNAALMSWRTAQDLGVKNHDVVKLDLKGRSLEMPVWVLPGVADYTVVLQLGNGRSQVGRVGAGAGFNIYQLRESSALWAASGLKVSSVGRVHRVATTQQHGRLEWYPGTEAAPKPVHAEGHEAGGAEHEAGHGGGHDGRPHIQEASLDHYRRNPRFAVSHMEHMPAEVRALPSAYPAHAYEGQQWGMTVDMSLCTSCNACAMACQAENNIPVVGKDRVMVGREMAWMRLDRYFTGSEAEETIEAIKQPVMCQHCENAPCEPVCPVGATVHAKDGGTNDMVYNRCIGTRYCANNCPFKVRRFNYFNFHEDFAEVQKMVHNPEVTVRMRGVIEKCTYCLQRINRARRDMRLSGAARIPDGAITTACEQACPVQAITFGDINDPESRVSKAKKRDRNYEMLAELNIKPRTSYLARIRNPNPELG